MLIEMAVANFRSIRDEQRLSLVAGLGKELAETNTFDAPTVEAAKPFTLLRSAAIYGPNAAGKSNFLKAFGTMRRIVLTSATEFKQLPVVPFRFDSQTIAQPSTFEVVVLIDGVRYQYGFRATVERIIGEWLFAFPKGRSQRWFERSLAERSAEENFQFGDKLIGDKDVWRRATRANALLLSTAVQLNSRQLKPLFDWFHNTLEFSGIHLSGLLTSLDCYLEGHNSRVIEFLRAADFAISTVRIDESSFDSSVDAILTGEPLKHPDLRHWKLYVGHRSGDQPTVELELSDESEGTQKMFALAGPSIEALSGGHVLFVDELHDNLHPLLVRYLVGLFHSPETNPKGAQLIFTTHETAILSQDVFRRDQIWFCERDPAQATRLFPLTDFNPRKGLENLERSYLSGRYGALPYLKRLSEAFAA